MTSFAATEAGMSSLLVPRPYRVVEKTDEGSDIVTLHVVPVDGSVPDFTPAQVSMVGAFGVGEAAISISSLCDEHDRHAYTIRRAGPITKAVVDTPVGGVITVRGPFGTSWPIADVDTKQLLIIAGGLGIAPLRAAVHAAIAHRDADNPVERVALLYGAKTPADLVYRSDLEEWAERGVEVTLTVDSAEGDWPGPVALVPELLGREVDLEWTDTTAFVCGPDPMMHFTAAALLRLDVPTERIWVTLERNMQCGNALCGHCQLGPFIVCRDGPVANYAEIGPFHQVKEL